LKCAHLVPTKAPLPEEVIFNQKQTALEKRHAAHKAQHKKRQIAKHDRNDNRTKRRKAGELLIQDGGAPNVHVSLAAGGGHGPTPTVAEVGGTAPERAGESVAAIEEAGRSGADPKSAGPKRAAPEQGSKRATPQQGSSVRPVKKARVRSKM
jgi:hypothetical protein